MKILWITNTIIGSMYKHMFSKESNGVWMDALLKDFLRFNEHELVIVTTGRNKDIVFLQEEKVKYYVLPGGYPIEYKHDNHKNAECWRELFNQEKPDIIHIWGTEFTHGLAALRESSEIPSIIYIQGILDTIARYYEAGINHIDLFKSITFRDILKRDSILAQKRKYAKRAINEKEMLEISKNVITENTWCNVHCKSIASEVETYHCPLNINKDFEDYQWSIEAMEPHTIMVNASGYPLKGLHMVIKAVNLVAKKYPDVKLYVPGRPMISDNNLVSKLKKPGYIKYTERLVSSLEINRNISFIGQLSPKEMAEKMASVNVFVMGSAIENHSSTLKEAMIVGTPCIASAVGGVPEYAIHGKNSLLYRFEEYELLAEYIIKIFEDSKLASELSRHAKKSMSSLHDEKQIYETIISIYKKVIIRKELELDESKTER